MKKLAQGFNTAAQDSNPGSLSRESGALPLSHCAQNMPQVKTITTIKTKPLANKKLELSIQCMHYIWKHEIIRYTKFKHNNHRHIDNDTQLPADVLSS